MFRLPFRTINRKGVQKRKIHYGAFQFTEHIVYQDAAKYKGSAGYYAFSWNIYYLRQCSLI